MVPSVTNNMDQDRPTAPVRNRRKVGSRKYQDYTPETLTEAVRHVKGGNLTQRQAAKKYGIPRSTLKNKIKGLHGKDVGRPKVLSSTEEKILAERFVVLSDYGFPITLIDGQMIISNYLDRLGRKVRQFKNNIPGREFMMGFMKRQNLSYRLTQNIKKKRASVNKETMNTYFDNLEDSLRDVPAPNIVNYDESCLTDDPGRKKCITRRGVKYPEMVQDSSKVSVSLMWAASASGELLPPFVVYKSKHLYDSWREGGPAGARYGRTKSGWMDEFCFQEWFKTIALPYFKKLDGPKAMIGDNLSSHLSGEVIGLCKKNGIKFICLPPNTTHLTQPLDKAVFAPMKKKWRAILSDWKAKTATSGATIPKEEFPGLLKQLVTDLHPNVTANIKSGFRACGIHPLDRQEVLKNLPSDPVEAAVAGASVDASVLEHLERKRGPEGTTPRQKRKRLDVEAGKSVGDKSVDEEANQSDSSVQDDSVSEVAESDVDVDDDFQDQDADDDYHGQAPARTEDVVKGDFVKFMYDADTYYGEVIDITNDGIVIKAMESCAGDKFRWPAREDVHTYMREDVKEKVNQPVPVGSRGMYRFE